MFASILALLTLSPTLILAQTSSPTVVCVPGLCLQGYSNTTLGSQLTAPGAPTSLHLLPGQYTTSTNPQFLHDILTSSSVSISSSPGFTNSSTLPLTLALQPGLAIYSDSLYSGQSAFSSLPTSPVGNVSVPLPAKALSISSNVFVTVNAGPNNRLILWDSIPDVSQLPASATGSLSLNNIQSFACSPTCAGSGICTAEGTCQCATGFTGLSCELCSVGFFGPNCQRCPDNCDSCDGGITGSGRCLKPVIANAPSTCNCLNGVCGPNGKCACTAGFTTSANGTACAQCSPGSFLTSTGDCKVCQIGCTQCGDITGNCITCKNGFTQNAGDRTKCLPPRSVTSTGTLCPDGSFSNGNTCTTCDSACQTCTAGTSNDCIVCASGRFTFNGACVTANSDGVCDGTNLLADNNKRECDGCGAKCTSCKISGFNGASTVNQRVCTGCLPGFFISQGECVESCPAGTVVSPQDSLTCQPCDASCKTCAGSSSFCLSCNNNQLASSGKCVATCPANTFSSSGSCLACHSDCASCSGGAFNQCTSCPSDRPVLLNGRCLSTCGKTQFFDSTTSSCQACDPNCSSCSGAGPSNCLACSSTMHVLRKGSCLAANCQGAISVIAGLGVCLSELVGVPQPSGTNSPAPLPTVTGLNTPTVITKRKPLEWWQILLMALGCAFIFVAIIWCCRRRQKKKRADKTTLFANGAVVNRDETSWRWKLLRFGEKLFGHTKSKKRVIVVSRPMPLGSDLYKLDNLRAAEEARYTPTPLHAATEEEDMVKLIGSYQTPEPSRYHPRQHRFTPADQRSLDSGSRVSASSLYSQMTGVPRRVPDPQQPMKKDLMSRFSSSTYSSVESRAEQQKQKGMNPFRK